MGLLRPISPATLRERLDAGEDLCLLDVREARELAICSIPGSVSIPLGELSRRSADLDPSRPTVCICHHGVRSARAASMLERAGFREVLNLSGGVDRWAAEVEPSMRRY